MRPAGATEPERPGKGERRTQEAGEGAGWVTPGGAQLEGDREHGARAQPEGRWLRGPKLRDVGVKR